MGLLTDYFRQAMKDVTGQRRQMVVLPQAMALLAASSQDAAELTRRRPVPHWRCRGHARLSNP